MENLRKKIAEAKKIVEELGLEEPYKSEAFGAVLTQLLLTERAKEKLEKPTHIEIGLEKRIEKFAKDADVTVDRLKHVFHFKKDDLALLMVSGEKQREQQMRATLLILTGLSYCYERGEILASDLRKKLKKLDIGLANLATNLARHRQFVLPEGESGSHAFTYLITEPGKKEGLRIIRELSGET